MKYQILQKAEMHTTILKGIKVEIYNDIDIANSIPEAADKISSLCRRNKIVPCEGDFIITETSTNIKGE